MPGHNQRMTDVRPNPDLPLPGTPDPWAGSAMPSRRDGPPFHMTEMIEAEPRLGVRIVERVSDTGSAGRLADAVWDAYTAARPIVTVGCGTSEHGALAVAEVLAEALAMSRFREPTPRSVPDPAALLEVGNTPGMTPGEAGAPIAVQAFEASLIPALGRGGLVIGVSHEGGTSATNEALKVARDWGSTVAIITASDRSPGARLADIVVETAELDQSWCHTVGYVSPIVASVAVGREVMVRDQVRGSDVPPVDLSAIRGVLEAGLLPESVSAVERMARHIATCDRVIVIGSGIDRIAARELVLKIEEGAHMPAAMRDTETLLHGHLAGVDEHTALVAIASGSDAIAREPRSRRLSQALRAALAIGIKPCVILASHWSADLDSAIDSDLTPAGRIHIPAGHHGLSEAAAALLGTAVPLQLLTERLARARKVDPDPIRRDDPTYLRAAEAAG